MSFCVHESRKFNIHNYCGFTVCQFCRIGYIFMLDNYSNITLFLQTLSWVDIQCYYLLDNLNRHLGINIGDYPELQKLYDNVASQPNIKNWHSWRIEQNYLVYVWYLEMIFNTNFWQLASFMASYFSIQLASYDVTNGCRYIQLL